MAYSTQNDPVITRLSALWALTEITLGGVLHALRIPLTGLLVGSTALACVYLIAITTSQYRSILKSLSAVMAIKMMSSPQASPFSYLAMSAQSLCCVPLAGPRGRSRIWVTVMFLLASFYSPLQKLAILYVTFGHQGLSVVLGELRDWVAPSLTTTEFLFFPVALWFGAHLATGFFLAKWLHRWTTSGRDRLELQDEWKRTETTTLPLQSPSQVFSLRHIASSTVIVIALSILFFFGSDLPTWFHVLWRPLLIILCWQLIIRPLITILSRRWTSTTGSDGNIRAVMDEFPRMWSILSFAQKKSIVVSGWTSRVRTFLRVILLLSLTRNVEVEHD
jgi:hypothetical protein